MEQRKRWSGQMYEVSAPAVILHEGVPCKLTVSAASPEDAKRLGAKVFHALIKGGLTPDTKIVVTPKK